MLLLQDKCTKICENRLKTSSVFQKKLRIWNDIRRAKKKKENHVNTLVAHMEKGRT